MPNTTASAAGGALPAASQEPADDPRTAVEIEEQVAALREALGDWKPPPNEEWIEQSINPMLPVVRMAYMLINRSPDEMREGSVNLRELGNAESVLKNGVEAIVAAAEYFESLSIICDIAARRIEAYDAACRENE